MDKVNRYNSTDIKRVLDMTDRLKRSMPDPENGKYFDGEYFQDLLFIKDFNKWKDSFDKYRGLIDEFWVIAKHLDGKL